MDYIVPDYYNRFSCTADACEDTCCAGWSIVIDPKTLAGYRNYPGMFGSRLHNSIDWKAGTFLKNRRRCAFLNEENLCDIYLEAGRSYLCRTCRTYPRHVEEFEGVREISLSLSCPEAAKIILGNREPVRFLTKTRETQQEEYEYFDYLLFTKLTDARALAIRLMQRRETDVRVRMAMVLSLCHDIQQRMNRGELFGIDELLRRYGEPDACQKFSKQLAKKGVHKKAPDSQKYFQVLYLLEVLREEWTFYLLETERKRYPCKGAEKTGFGVDEIVLEQLMVYFLFVYFAGAVYDARLFEKGKLAVYSTMMIAELLKAKACKPDLQSLVRVAHCYAREVEHSDKNLHILEQEFLTNPIFRLEPMLGWVMQEEGRDDA